MLILLAAVCAFVLTVLFGRIAIPMLRALKAGQSIREIGPKWHNSKAGTPTMGGIAFAIPLTLVLVVAMLAAPALDVKINLPPLLLTLLLAVGNGAIGVVDDLTKFKKKQNEGLTAPQKYLLQL